MEWAVWTASSDSELDEEEAPSNIGQQRSLCEVAVQSSTNNAQASIDVPFVNKSASTGDGWYSRESVKAEEKPPCKDFQDLIRCENKDRSTVPVPHGIRSKLPENISGEDGISYSESEDFTTQIGKDDEQELVTQEDLGETAEELEFYKSLSEFGDSWKQNFRGSDVQRKRNFTEDEQGQASKLAKISEHPQKKQIPGEKKDCGESTSDQTLCQWSASFQARPLEENYAAEEPINCTQSTESLCHSSLLVKRQESFCHSSLLVKRQEVPNEDMMYTCPECNIKCKNSSRLNRHRVIVHKIETSYKCPECNKPFVTANSMNEHRRALHNAEKSLQCTECIETFSSSLLLKAHWKTHHTRERLKCPKCIKVFSSPGSLGDHQIAVHKAGRPFQCTACRVKFRTLVRLNKHQSSAHGTKANKSNKHISNPPPLLKNQAIQSNKPISNPDTLLNNQAIQSNEPISNPDTLLNNQAIEIYKPTSNPEPLLNNQVAVHNTGDLFQCWSCNLKFSSSWHLNRHLLTHINVLRMQLNIQQVITFCSPSSQGPWFRLPL